MQVSDIKQKLNSVKGAIEECNSAITERIRYKEICDTEIIELENLKSSLLASLGINNFNIPKSKLPSDAHDRIDKAIILVIGQNSHLMIKKTHELVVNRHGITTKEETTRIRIYALLKEGFVEKVDPNANRGMEFKLTEKGLEAFNKFNSQAISNLSI